MHAFIGIPRQVWVNVLSHTSDTMVDGERVEDKILLKDNDLIEIGQRKFIFHSLNPEAGPGSAKVPAQGLAAPLPFLRVCLVCIRCALLTCCDGPPHTFLCKSVDSEVHVIE